MNNTESASVKPEPETTFMILVCFRHHFNIITCKNIT